MCHSAEMKSQVQQPSKDTPSFILKCQETRCFYAYISSKGFFFKWLKRQNFNLFYSQGSCLYLCPHQKVPEQTPPLLVMDGRRLRHAGLLCVRASVSMQQDDLFFSLIILYERFCGTVISNAWLTLTRCTSGVRHHGKHKVSLLLLSLLRVCRLQKIINWSLCDFSKLSVQRKASAPVVLRGYKSSGIDLWLQREKQPEKKKIADKKSNILSVLTSASVIFQ